MSRLRRAAFGWCAAALVGMAALPLPAWAHDPGISSVSIARDAAGVSLRAVFSTVDIISLLDIDTDGDGALDGSELERSRETLRRLAVRLFAVDMGGESGAPELRELVLDDSGAVHFLLVVEGVGIGPLEVRSERLTELGLGHRQFVRAHHAGAGVVFEGLLDADRNRLTLPALDVDVSSRSRGAVALLSDFLVLGVEHILIGYDHLAFLIALLIVGGTLTEVAKTISAFTVAHSITLALAGLDLVRLPSGAVEAAIALSIVYVGVENLLGAGAERRWVIAFGFGLIHGFGFASVLGGLAAETGGQVVVPLVGFNLGVEIGQIAIAAAVLPLVRRLREHPAFVARYAPACSLLIVATGLFWLAERTLLAG